MTTPDGTTRRGNPATPHRSTGDGRFVAGTVLAGRYRIVALLGRGGMGEVYKADDLTLDHPVALKFLPDSLGLSPHALTRFHAEVRIARQVSHPNVCRVYDVGEVDGLRFLTMEFIDGEDLSSLLRRIGRLPGDKAVEIARQLCAGLAAAHDAGVIHRDLKPANVMIDGRGRARVTDFGVAAIAREVRGGDELAGTPAYMAPEQLKGQDASVRSDVYSLGLVLYELFTGRRAIEAKNISEALLHHSSGTPVTTPSSWIGDIDKTVERAILRCLETDPGARPASAIQVAAALPGGDPLQAALAAGETPSPEMVAAAGGQTAMRPAVAIGVLVMMVAILAASSVVNVRRSIVANLPARPSAEVLAYKARELIRDFGFDVPARDEAFGFEYDAGYLSFDRNQRGSANRLDRLRSSRPSPIQFWYRDSPEPLVALMVPDGPSRLDAVSRANPEADVRGMRHMILDPQGRLVFWRAVPGDLEPAAGPGARIDWSVLFAAAGLGRDTFSEIAPLWVPPDPFDERAAWQGTYPDQPDLPLRIEAAAFAGRLVAFRLFSPWAPLEPAAGRPLGARVGFLLNLIVLFLSPLAVVLAWINMRTGRGDRQGAVRVGGALFIALFVEWILTVDHVFGPGEFQLYRLGTGTSLLQAVNLAVMYLALEPHVRRRWPEVLIGWSRVLAGRFRDPLVGRDVLAGIALAGGLMAVWTAGNWWFGRVTDSDFPPGAVLTVPRALATVIGAAGSGLFLAIVLCFFVLVARVVVRSDWLAATATVLLTTVVMAGGSVTANPFATAVGAALGLMASIVLFRFGLLAAAAAFCAWSLFPPLRIALAWGGLAGIILFFILIAVATWACYLAIGSPRFLPRRQMT